MHETTYTGTSDFKADLEKLYPDEHFKYAHEVFPHGWKNVNDLAFPVDKEPDYCGHLRTLVFNQDSLAISLIYITDQPLTGCKKTTRVNLDSQEDTVFKEPRDVDYVRESLNRTKKIFRRLIMHNYSSDIRHVTLTYADACHDRDEHFHHLRALALRFRRHYGTDMNYIAVPELHPGGHGWHWHLVLNNGWFDYEHFYRELWKQGIIHVSPVPDSPAFANAGNMANYLVKYIGKDMAHTPTAKRRYTRGGVWKTDWQTTTGFTPESGKTFRKVIALLASLCIPCQSGMFEPYPGQLIHSIMFDSGRYPDLDLSRCFKPKGPPPVCKVYRKGGKLITPEQGGLFYES